MKLIQFNENLQTFNPDLLTLGPIKEVKENDVHYYKIPLLYNDSKIRIRLPKHELHGIYHNRDMETFNLLYPKLYSENNTTEEINFLLWLQDFETCVKEKLFAAIKSDNIFKDFNFAPIFRELKNGGDAMFIKFFPDNGGTLKHLCFDLKGNKQDINKYCKYGNIGKYIPIVDIPSIYIPGNNDSKSKYKGQIQIFGNSLFAQIENTQETLNIREILGNDFIKL